MIPAICQTKVAVVSHFSELGMLEPKKDDMMKYLPSLTGRLDQGKRAVSNNIQQLFGPETSDTKENSPGIREPETTCQSNSSGTDWKQGCKLRLHLGVTET